VQFDSEQTTVTQMMMHPQTPIQLYRHLLRRIRLFPVGVQDYYRHFVRQVRDIQLRKMRIASAKTNVTKQDLLEQQFNSHSDESDPKRVDDIIRQAVHDFDWLERKVSGPRFVIQFDFNNNDPFLTRFARTADDV
jgi:hypothetical protein